MGYWIFPQRMAFALSGRIWSICPWHLPGEPNPIADVQLLPQEGGHGGLRGAQMPPQLPLLLRALRRRRRRDRPGQRRLPVLTQRPPGGGASLGGA